jgi:plastocyanin
VSAQIRGAAVTAHVRSRGCTARLPALRHFAVWAVALAAAGAVKAAPPAADLHGVTYAGGRPVSNAVVWLDAPRTAAAPGRRLVLDQRNLQFSPRVLAVQVGTTVDFPNNDRVFHNVFSFRDGKVFDLGMYPVGAIRHITFDQPGLSRIFCNIHPGMAAYVVAVDSPYFAVSNDDGTFTIAAMAPGPYTYHAWRAGAADVTGTWSDGTLSIRWP